MRRARLLDRKRAYDVFREECKDADSEETWTHKARYSKIALTSEQVAKRLNFGLHVQGWGRTQVYYYNRMV